MASSERTGAWRPWWAVAVGGVLALACAPHQSQPVIPSTVPDHRDIADAKIVTTSSNGLVVHTLVAPETGLGVTSHVIETPNALIVVDAQFLTPHARQLRDYCRSLDKPIERIIVTHGHPDHYFGLVEFEDVPRYALPVVRAQIARRHRAHLSAHQASKGDWVPAHILAPNADLVVGTFHVDGVAVMVERVRGAEDTDHALLSLPDHGILIAQDLVSNGYHAFTGTGALTHWRELLAQLAARNPKHVLAGHGPPGSTGLLIHTARYLEFAERAKADAHTQQDMVDAITTEFPDLRGPFLVDVSAQITFRDRPGQP